MKRLLSLAMTIAMLLVVATPASAKKYGETLRILAIGNSFSDDGMEHLPALLKDLGVKDVELARLYVGGCTLERHMQFYNKEEAAYLFYHSAAGQNEWVKAEEKYSIQQALSMGEWDIITMQQASGVSGLYESYVPYLEQLIAAVRKAQKDIQIMFGHMSYAPILTLSALEGKGVKELLNTAIEVYEQLTRKLETGILNRALKDWIAAYPCAANM